jgi:hypothetical protein
MRMGTRVAWVVLMAALAAGTAAQTGRVMSGKAPGFRGIWFALGQYKSAYGDKYSGGLGTYTANHVPVAAYSAVARKTFFTYGGEGQSPRRLQIMAAAFDHRSGTVTRPTIVCDKLGVTDPHDNGSLCLDTRGHVWVFVSGRGRARMGFKYRSVRPYSVDAFELISTEEMTYPQPWVIPGKGFLHLFTKYTRGRELYFETSRDGVAWSEDRKLAGMEGHYQVSARRGGTLVSAFMRHPGGDVDKRTDLYVVQTRDVGATWQTMAGETLPIPLTDPACPALVRAYSAEGKLVYINDVSFDARGNPIVLYVTSGGSEPGPEHGPRMWTVAHWTGREWRIHDVAPCDHNYDMGSLYVEPGGVWRVIGPTEPGPQAYGTGGEVTIWTSRDQGKTWRKTAEVTSGSDRNQSYVRRPLDAHPDFYAFWADGHAFQPSPSSLYFTNRAGDRVWRLPETIEGDTARPERVR